RRQLGRAVLHGHRVPGRLLPQLPPLPAGLPGDGSRPCAGKRMSRTLLVFTPLRVEALALGTRSGWTVVRSGMGRSRARGAAARGRAVDARAVAAVGLLPGACARARAGRAVRGRELGREGAEPISVPGSALLAAALRRRGLRAHVGPIRSVERITTSAERRALRDEGVLAVDMESAWLAQSADARPLA